jgi:uncharacterized protein YndB with AHSA1/START domain
VKITIETTVAKDLETVWKTWTTPEHINHWNFASEDWHNPRSQIDLQVGGQFVYRMEAKDGSFGFDFGGTFLQVEALKSIVFAMEDQRQVEIQFETTENGIRVRESFDAEDENSAEMQKQSWQAILNRFRDYTESL